MNTAKNATRGAHEECQDIVQMVGEAESLPARHRLLLLCLAAEEKPRVVVSLDVLGTWAMCGAASAERAVNELEKLGLLTVWRAVSRGQRRLRPVAYQINKARLAGIRRRGA